MGSIHSAHRAVAVLDGATLRASGYLISPEVVVTCQHTFEREGDWRLRRWDGTVIELDLGRTLRWPEADVALLFLHEPLTETTPVSMGELNPLFPGPLPFQMYGWPLWGSELGPDRVRQEGGRMVRGTIEPSDISPDHNVVLRPGHWGASDRLGTSDWAGMSGAAVFSLDRLVGVQRRQVDVLRPDSIEARPVAPLWRDEDFVRVMREQGVELDIDWMRSGNRAQTRRLEVHGPTEVPLFTVTDFQVRSDRWDRLIWRLGGTGDTTPHERSPVRPIEWLTVAPNDASQLGSQGQLLVEGSSTSDDDTVVAVHPFTVTAPSPTSIAALYECAMWLLDKARAGGPPPQNLRAALLGKRAADLLSEALPVAVASPVLDLAAQGLPALHESLARAKSFAQRRISDPQATASAEYREDDKYVYHRAYGPRRALAEQSMGTFDREDPFWSQTLRVLGHDGIEGVDAYLRPRPRDMRPERGSFEALLMQLLLEDNVVDVGSGDFQYVHGRLNDVVNSLIDEGLATWEHGSTRLRPTAVGRLWLRDTLRRLAG